jgi:hypothetical protein
VELRKLPTLFENVATGDALYPCHPDRARTTLSLSKGSEGEWKDPDTAFFARPLQGVFTMKLSVSIEIS